MSFSRTGAFAAGVAVTLVLGAGTAVASGSATLVLGHGNATGATTGLANSKGVPLSLQARKGSAPLKVNSPVKVTHLNSDLLDGKDSTAFLSARSAAADSARLGGQPASAFLPAGGTAANATHAGTADTADRLGGQDPSAYLTNVFATSTAGGGILVAGSVIDALTVPPGTYQLLFTADLRNPDGAPATFFCEPFYVHGSTAAGPFSDAYAAPQQQAGLAITQVVSFPGTTSVSISCYTTVGNASGTATILNSNLSLTQVHLAGGTATARVGAAAGRH